MTTQGASSESKNPSQEDELLISLIRQYYTNEELQPIVDEEKLLLILKQVKAIREYAEEQFPALNLLTNEEMVILSQSIFVPHQSPEKAIVATDRNYMEVKRSLSRFYGLSLLQSEAGFDAFIANQQRDSKFIPVLKKEEYKQLARKFSSLDPLTLQVLKVATLISSVPLSAEARKRADKIFGKNNYIVDSVEFPAQVFEDIEVARKIYPQVDGLWQQYPEREDQQTMIELFQSAFSHRRHYRHMLYTEGSQSMFKTLLDDLNSAKLTKRAFDFWILYWNINIVGFQGNVDPKGSYYLTSNTYRAMSALESVLESVFEDSSLTTNDLLKTYLMQRAGFLGLSDILNTGYLLNLNEQIFMAHIGAMMRLYHPEQGQILSASYLVCRKTIRELRVDFFKPDDTMPTPTYAPALFANARDFLRKRYEEEKVFQSTKRIKSKYFHVTAEEFKDMLAVFETLVLCLPLYLSALHHYKQLRKEGKIAPNVPLSFQSIADPKWITQLFDKSIILDNVNILALIDITVSETGAVSFTQKVDYQDRLAEQFSKKEDSEALEDEFTEKKRTYLVGYKKPTVATETPLVIASTQLKEGEKVERKTINTV